VNEFEMYFADGLHVGGKGKRRFINSSSVNRWVLVPFTKMGISLMEAGESLGRKWLLLNLSAQPCSHYQIPVQVEEGQAARCFVGGL